MRPLASHTANSVDLGGPPPWTYLQPSERNFDSNRLKSEGKKWGDAHNSIRAYYFVEGAFSACGASFDQASRIVSEKIIVELASPIGSSSRKPRPRTAPATQESPTGSCLIDQGWFSKLEPRNLKGEEGGEGAEVGEVGEGGEGSESRRMWDQFDRSLNEISLRSFRPWTLLGVFSLFQRLYL